MNIPESQSPEFQSPESQSPESQSPEFQSPEFRSPEFRSREFQSRESQSSSRLPPRVRDRFEELRAAYFARVAGDRAQLMQLRMRFERAGPMPPGIYDDVQRVAHGMAGTAGVFEEFDVSRIARRLETAALTASHSPGVDTDAAVCRALDALVDLLLTVSP